MFLFRGRGPWTLDSGEAQFVRWNWQGRAGASGGHDCLPRGLLLTKRDAAPEQARAAPGPSGACLRELRLALPAQTWELSTISSGDNADGVDGGAMGTQVSQATATFWRGLSGIFSLSYRFWLVPSDRDGSRFTDAGVDVEPS